MRRVARWCDATTGCAGRIGDQEVDGALGVFGRARSADQYRRYEKDFSQAQSSKGGNPFSGISVGGTDMSLIVKAHDPSFTDSKSVYAHIAAKLAGWADEAVTIRNKYQ